MGQDNPITRGMIEVAAAAIANARAGRRGAPPISNILQTLERVQPKLHAEVLEDAEAALKAILRVHEPIAPPPEADTFPMDLYSPHGVASFGQALQTPGLILHLECIAPPHIDVTTYTREHTQKLGAAIEAVAILAKGAADV